MGNIFLVFVSRLQLSMVKSVFVNLNLFLIWSMCLPHLGKTWEPLLILYMSRGRFVSQNTCCLNWTRLV